MVLGKGYNDLVHFDEVPIGRTFASSKTGRAFVKTGKTSWVPDPDYDRAANRPAELFEAKTLVYLGSVYAHTLY